VTDDSTVCRADRRRFRVSRSACLHVSFARTYAKAFFLECLTLSSPERPSRQRSRHDVDRSCNDGREQCEKAESDQPGPGEALQSADLDAQHGRHEIDGRNERAHAVGGHADQGRARSPQGGRRERRQWRQGPAARPDKNASVDRTTSIGMLNRPTIGPKNPPHSGGRTDRAFVGHADHAGADSEI
jgi:hypothetical protein